MNLWGKAKQLMSWYREYGLKGGNMEVAHMLRTKQIYRSGVVTPYTAEEINAQREDAAMQKGKIAVLVSALGKETLAIQETIRSVLCQTYKNLILIILDADEELSYDDDRVRFLSHSLINRQIICEAEYVAVLDAAAVLHPAALYACVQAIEEQNADFVYTDEMAHMQSGGKEIRHKPSFSPDLLRSCNYVGGFAVMSCELFESADCVENYIAGYYDVYFRASEKAKRIVRIPRVLFESYEQDADKHADIQAITSHLGRMNLQGEASSGEVTGVYRIRYVIKGEPLVSILIPNKDHALDLKKCIDSIIQNTTYQNWEIIIIENNSTQQETFSCYKELEKDPRIRVIYWEQGFNYAAINNFAARQAHGEYLLLLNNDVEIISPDWIEEMLMLAQRDDVGIVGSMLLYPDNTVQHGGILLGVSGVAAHAHKGFDNCEAGYMNRLATVQNYSAVTAACMMIPARVYREVGGMDEAYKVAFNDVDFCMRIRKADYLIAWTPYAKLYHYESKSRGFDVERSSHLRFMGEVERFQKQWQKELLAGDPYYNPNLTLVAEDFSLR